jgi:hypothetical protein
MENEDIRTIQTQIPHEAKYLCLTKQVYALAITNLMEGKKPLFPYPVAFQKGCVFAFLHTDQQFTINERLQLGNHKDKLHVTWKDLSVVDFRVGTVTKTRFVNPHIDNRINLEMCVDFGKENNQLILADTSPALSLVGKQIAAITPLNSGCQYVVSYLDNKGHNVPFSLNTHVPNGTKWLSHPMLCKL